MIEILSSLALLVLLGVAALEDVGKGWEEWDATAYCNDKKCTGKSPGDKGYGITASGKQAATGMVAVNWLPFGTEVEIKDVGKFTVEDHGAKSIFGDKNNHFKRVDIWMPNHASAVKFGRKKVKLRILDK